MAATTIESDARRKLDNLLKSLGKPVKYARRSREVGKLADDVARLKIKHSACTPVPRMPQFCCSKSIPSPLPAAVRQRQAGPPTAARRERASVESSADERRQRRPVQPSTSTSIKSDNTSAPDSKNQHLKTRLDNLRLAAEFFFFFLIHFTSVSAR